MYSMDDMKVIGSCSKHFLWMKEEGFFEDKTKISKTWLFKSSDDVLQRMKNMFDVMIDENTEEWNRHETDNDIQDAFYTILLIEQLKSGKDSLSFDDDQIIKWLSLYGFSVMLEIQRRMGMVELDSEDVPLEKIRWKLTEKGEKSI